ncbi:hypothetical protein GE09DRAFT_1231391 [Coniochaeta sp. 2T2.1]|nr:hypothetical protein GE09DRAFT_1231391 [Coniochaeta sp. 2T2.1]
MPRTMKRGRKTKGQRPQQPPPFNNPPRMSAPPDRTVNPPDYCTCRAPTAAACACPRPPPPSEDWGSDEDEEAGEVGRSRSSSASSHTLVDAEEYEQHLAHANTVSALTGHGLRRGGNAEVTGGGERENGRGFDAQTIAEAQQHRVDHQPAQQPEQSTNRTSRSFPEPAPVNTALEERRLARDLLYDGFAIIGERRVADVNPTSGPTAAPHPPVSRRRATGGGGDARGRGGGGAGAGQATGMSDS